MDWAQEELQIQGTAHQPNMWFCRGAGYEDKCSV